jgi:hypothetical protein
MNPAVYRRTHNTMKTNSMKQFALPLYAAAMLALATGFSGCLAVAAGAGAGAAVAYVRGKLEANLGADYEVAIAATNRAIQQLGYAKVSESKDSLVDNFVVRNADDKRIDIRLENAARGLTKVTIRVGHFFGDQALSVSILEKIKANL